MNATPVESNSITFLNRTGDITITWDDHNREQILAMVRKKMTEGYSFFTMKKVPLVDIYRKVKVTSRNLNSTTSLSVPDAEFEKMVTSIDDRDVARLLLDESAVSAKRQGAKARSLETVKRAENAEEVVRSQSVGVRRIVGG